MEYEQRNNGILISLAQFFAWLVASVVTILDVLYIRGAVSAILSFAQGLHTVGYHLHGGVGIDFSFAYAMTAIDEILLFVLALVAMGFVIWIEYYFRKGRPKGLLFKRIGAVLGVEAAIVLASIILQVIF